MSGRPLFGHSLRSFDRVSHDQIDAVGCLLLKRLNRVKVDVGGRADGRVTEGRADRLEVSSRCECQRPETVPQIVEPYGGELSTPYKPVEGEREGAHVPQG